MNRGQFCIVTLYSKSNENFYKSVFLGLLGVHQSTNSCDGNEQHGDISIAAGVAGLRNLRIVNFGSGLRLSSLSGFHNLSLLLRFGFGRYLNRSLGNGLGNRIRIRNRFGSGSGFGSGFGSGTTSISLLITLIVVSSLDTTLNAISSLMVS